MNLITHHGTMNNIANEWAQVCDYECLYRLAGLEKDRYSIQIKNLKNQKINFFPVVN